MEGAWSALLQRSAIEYIARRQPKDLYTATRAQWRGEHGIGLAKREASTAAETERAAERMRHSVAVLHGA